MPPLHSTDTIAAIATPVGTGGIGIIRISGSSSLSILKQVFTPRYNSEVFESHKMYYGNVSDRTGQVLDEVLAVYMQAPSTYTREDIVELHCHGSYRLLQLILKTILECGARSAEQGEFTKRAFLAGRIDLTQAEAVIDLLQARTEKGISLAVNQLQGSLTSELEKIRMQLVEILAIIEVAIDFPEDDVDLINSDELLARVHHFILHPLEELIRLASGGKVIRDGVNVVIAGRPNVGKSSLLNALLQEDRALVTPIAGTTRDTIEELISVRGIPVNIIDTAGIRAHSDLVEEMGIERTKNKMEAADLVLFLIDAAADLTEYDHELFKAIRQKKHIVVLNKKDKTEKKRLLALENKFAASRCVAISAKQEDGLGFLQDAIYEMTIDNTVMEADTCAPNIRHLGVLEKTADVCRGLVVSLQSGAPCDLLAVEVQSALACLGDIIGLTTPEDVLDAIFSEFCIGK
ncbi:MAG: tRNA uridine-5-carboxymethylaminomethyl(34) synthesis GTPase MnmE [Desulfobulbus propionicus]|nr:MAG: tRNA uridine-5-carboxymethylaminomethyl(34) synthesis GTPase MnmE [Desulfobulbus propionicus]